MHLWVLALYYVPVTFDWPFGIIPVSLMIKNCDSFISGTRLGSGGAEVLC